LIEGFNSSAKKGGKGVDPIQKSLINVKGSLQKAEKRNDELEEALKEAEEAAKYLYIKFKFSKMLTLNFL
jgi:hypothetical protein